jgi:ABC-type phosphate transport system substrate-binding protein
MRKRMLIAVTGVAVFGGLFASSAMAAPPERADDPFVCPVLTVPQAAQVSDRFDDIGNGESTFAPGNAGSADTFNGNVPNQATNADGSGSPDGAHSAPGDTDYTAIWSGNQP